MAPRVVQASSSVLTTPQEKWVKVTWMPHTTLSQTSHVCLGIRSAHVSLDPLLYGPCGRNVATSPEQQWSVRARVFAIGGLPLMPIATMTPNATVTPRTRRQPKDRQQEQVTLRPSVSYGTHQCCWDAVVQIPIRWRDLPRDAYLHFEVLRLRDQVVSLKWVEFVPISGISEPVNERDDGIFELNELTHSINSLLQPFSCMKPPYPSSACMEN